VERLGIPEYNWWSEGLHGAARAGLATVFPQAIGLAATWDTGLMSRVATAISDEARAKHHEFLHHGVREMYTGLTFWSPNINIFRDPRWGRGHETYGEDPYLTGRMGVTFVTGLQEGSDPHYLKLVATPKHYAVHSGPEPARHHFNAIASERDLWETYLLAFEACVREGRAVSVMGAYNRTNGEACCASKTLLADILRGEFGFDGYVVSDCWAIDDIYRHHRLVETPEQAAALAVEMGCELNCGETYWLLGRAVAQGLISEATIDQAVTRLFTARFRLGMFDPPEMVSYARIPYSVVDSPAHRALALEAGRKSVVLVKNDGLLPLDKGIRSIAVIGPNADDLEVLLGNYNATPSQAVTVLEGIRRKLGPTGRIYYARGCPLADGWPTLSPIPAAYLRPPEADAGTSGLLGTYYDNPLFVGRPVMERVDREVDFVWKKERPLAGHGTAPFAVRWTGALVPPKSGTYRLGVKGCSHFSLFLDGALITDGHNPHHPMTLARDVNLEAGRLYHLRLDFASESHDAHAQLLWAVPGQEADDLTAALDATRRANAVVLCLGLSPLVEGKEMPVSAEGFVGGDRTDIALPRPQQELLERVCGLGKPTVLVLLSGSAVAIPWAAEHVPAILAAWYPGEEGGMAVADVLFGDYNPAGRLPVTFYKSLAQLPPFEDYSMAGRTYRFMTEEPLYPFGHGLSYTRFEYGNLRVEPGQISVDGQATASLDVTNVGDRTGDEVVQLYVRYVDSKVTRPVKELKGFTRIALAPGETKPVSFTLSARQLAYRQAGQWIVEPGKVQLLVSSSSADVRLTGEVTIG
jgi:beta-glucosidase